MAPENKKIPIFSGLNFLLKLMKECVELDLLTTFEPFRYSRTFLKNTKRSKTIEVLSYFLKNSRKLI